MNASDVESRIEQPLLSRVPAWLRWTDDSDILRDVCRGHIRWAFYRLKLWSTEVNYFDHIRNLEPARQQRLLLSPLMHHLLFLHINPPPEISTELQQFLTDDLRSARSLIAESDTSVKLDGRPSIPCASQGQACEVLVDTSYGIWRPATPKELRIADERLLAALNLVSSISAFAENMISACIQLIVRTSLERKSSYFSSSHRYVIGRVVFGNAHLRRKSVEDIADSLVHEAIHAMLYKLELVEPIFSDMALASQTRITSPWSGRNLSLTSFTHACFVWYGLAHFWAMSERLGQESAASSVLRQRALDGFRKGIDDRVLTPLHGVRPGLKDIVKSLSATLPPN